MPTVETLEEFRKALRVCLPKKSSMKTSEIQKKMDSELFPSATLMKCLGILANDKVGKYDCFLALINIVSSDKRFELKARFRAIYANLIQIKIEIRLKRFLFPEKMGEVASFCFFSYICEWMVGDSNFNLSHTNISGYFLYKI